MTTAKKDAAAKLGSKGASAQKTAGAKAKAGAESKSVKKPASLAKGKDPKGGLTAEGRRYFKEKDGLNLRPGVKGKVDTPEKMVRKGSFLRRHYANPPGPVKDEKGEPTRQALQAKAWGEPVPQNEADERKLAEKGSELLEEYHAIKDEKAPASKSAARKVPAKTGAANEAPARKAAVKKAAVDRGPAKKAAARRSPGAKQR